MSREEGKKEAGVGGYISMGRVVMQWEEYVLEDATRKCLTALPSPLNAATEIQAAPDN